HGLKEYVNEFERIRYQRISAREHDLADTLLPVGIKMQVQSRNAYREGKAPDQIYQSKRAKLVKRQQATTNDNNDDDEFDEFNDDFDNVDAAVEEEEEEMEFG